MSCDTVGCVEDGDANLGNRLAVAIFVVEEDHVFEIDARLGSNGLEVD